MGSSDVAGEIRRKGVGRKHSSGGNGGGQMPLLARGNRACAYHREMAVQAPTRLRAWGKSHEPLWPFPTALEFLLRVFYQENKKGPK